MNLSKGLAPTPSHFLILVCISMLAACGGSSESGSPDVAMDPPPVSDFPDSDYLQISGTLDAPTGVTPENLKVVALGREYDVAARGDFSAEIQPEAVSLLVATSEGRELPLARIVVDDAALDPAAVEISTSSTAVSMIFLSPLIMTQNLADAARILEVIEGHSAVPSLAQAIDGAFNDVSPFQNSDFRAAYISALELVALDLAADMAASSKASQVAPSDEKVLMLRLPKRSKEQLQASKSSASSLISIDNVYTDIEVTESSSNYRLRPTTLSVNAVDWLAEVGEVEVSGIFSHELESLVSNSFTAYDRVPPTNVPVGLEIASAQGLLRWFDFVSVALNAVSDRIRGFVSPDGVLVPQETDALYIVRFFSSGNAGPVSEYDFVVNEVPNGAENHKRARVINHLSAAMDALGLAVDLIPVTDDSAVLKCTQDSLLNLYEETSLSIELTNSPQLEIEVAIGVFSELSADFLLCLGLETVIRTGSGIQFIDKIWSVFGLPLKVVATGGKIAERYLFLSNRATPLESFLVQVGSPLEDDSISPTTPETLSATPISTSSIQLEWSASSDNDDVAEYVIYRDDVPVASSMSLSLLDVELTPSTTYCYSVEAYDFVGNPSGRFNPSVCATTLAVEDMTPPSTPTNVTATPLPNLSIELTWDASTDDSGVIDSYQVFRDDELIATVNNDPFIDTGLASSQEYCYKIIAVDPSGNPSGPTSAICAVATDSGNSGGSGTALQGWIALADGDPGVPGDGILIESQNITCSPDCWTVTTLDEEPDYILANGAEGFTVSSYFVDSSRPNRVSNFIPAFQFIDYSDSCGVFLGTFNPRILAAPIVSGVGGTTVVISRDYANQVAADLVEQRPSCAGASADTLFISRIRGDGTRQFRADGVYVSIDSDPFIPKTSGEWVSVAEGEIGLPGDGLSSVGELIEGKSQFTIGEEVVLNDSVGLTLSLYSESIEAIAEAETTVVFGYTGFPTSCRIESPPLVFFEARTLRGVSARYRSFERSLLGLDTALFSLTGPGECNDITVDDIYIAALRVGGIELPLDGAFVGIGEEIFPFFFDLP